MRRLVLVLVLVVSSVLGAARAGADEPDKKEAARAIFEQGLAHFDRGEWSAALADFLQSRALYPTRTATINAAVCMRKEGRYDEALDLVEDLLRSFPDLPPADRVFADGAIAELRPLVGSIDVERGEPGASVVVDGRPRGSLPLTGPVRVSAGTHVVRVYKEGFVPLERRVDVAGRQTLSFDAKLAPLGEGGQLVVTEAQGRSLEVIVDGIVIGRTPFDGRLALGRHTVALRGEGDLGTAPAEAIIDPKQPTRLALAAEDLDASLRVMPTPASSLVSIDGVIVGNGVWEGRLRAGEHTIEVASDGFLAATRKPVLVHGERSSVAVLLERDVTSQVFQAKNPPRVFAELEGGGGVGLHFGGDVRDACSGSCSADAPLMAGISVRAGYQTSSGILVGLDAGVFAFSAGLTGRATQLQPRGLGPNQGVVDDDLYLRGFRFGPAVGYRFGSPALPLTARVGAGVVFGSGGDNRTGAFATASGARYETTSSEASRALYGWAAPEFLAALPIGGGFEVNLGLALLVLAAFDAPSWSDKSPVLAAPAGQRGDGVATYGSGTMAGGLIVALAPSLGLRASF